MGNERRPWAKIVHSVNNSEEGWHLRGKCPCIPHSLFYIIHPWVSYAKLRVGQEHYWGPCFLHRVHAHRSQPFNRHNPCWESSQGEAPPPASAPEHMYMCIMALGTPFFPNPGPRPPSPAPEQDKAEEQERKKLEEVGDFLQSSSSKASLSGNSMTVSGSDQGVCNEHLGS